MMKTSRQLVLTALLRLERDGGYSNLVLNSMLQKSEFSPQEKAFATRLFYGTVEKKLLLDYNISKLLKKQKLDIEIRCILRMGMYQLLFMDNVPDNAVVNESVKLCAFAKKNSAKGFVNAVLRNKIREGKQINLPRENEKDYLSVKYSVNESIISIFKEDYGKEKAEKILSAFSDETRIFIKVNSLKTTSQKLIDNLNKSGITAIEIMKDCLEIKGGGNLIETSEFKNGEFFVQDFASQMCVNALECENAKRILDVCAAPGGKSFNAYISSNGRAEVVSCDISENRVSLIEEGKQRLGLDGVIPTVQDASLFNESLGMFDRVLCDAVCSGLGVISKKPEIRYKNIDKNELWEIQNNILNNASRYLKKGGILVYSTCTLNKRENEEVVENFLKAHSDFEPYKEGAKTFFPDSDFCDGFFVCAIKRKEN